MSDPGYNDSTDEFDMSYPEDAYEFLESLGVEGDAIKWVTFVLNNPGRHEEELEDQEVDFTDEELTKYIELMQDAEEFLDMEMEEEYWQSFEQDYSSSS